MHSTDNGLEIANVECPRIEVSVPSHDVERMVVEHKLVDALVLLHIKRKIAHLVTGLEQNGPPYVTLRIRRAFDKLAEIILVPRRIPDVAPTLEYHQLRLVSLEIHSETMENSAMDHEVVAFAVLEISVNALEYSVALAHIHQLVRLRVPVKKLVVPG